MLTGRKIIHVDMDAFFASVEQRDFPELRGRPVAVGGTSARGVVAAASYEARKYGVHSAMPSALAAKKCPGLIFVPSRFDVYRSVSKQIRSIFQQYTDIIEPLSLDEAYLDVTEPKNGPASATSIARAIKEQIRTEVGITASAGVSFNKFLAKIGSDFQKPDGLTVIKPQEALGLIARLPIEKFFGVGPVTASRMQKMGIHRGADLMRLSLSELTEWFGKSGQYYFNMVRCLDERPVRTVRTRKSVGAEKTFESNLVDERDLVQRLDQISARVAERMAENNLFGHTITLKIKTKDFAVNTRQTTSETSVSAAEEIRDIATLLLLHAPGLPELPVRLLGISVSNLRRFADHEENRQLKLGFSKKPGSERFDSHAH